MPLGNILVGTDFSEGARDAVGRAATLPVGRGSSITLAHALPPRLPPGLAGSLERAAHARLEAARSALTTALAAAQRGDVDVFTIVAAGSPVDVIDSLARDGLAELVVVGRGRGGRLGAVAAQVARACDRQVLVVATAPEQPYARPLAAIDLSERSRAVLEAALRLCAEAGALGVVHAFDGAQSAELVWALRDSGLTDSDLAAWSRSAEAQARAACEAELASVRLPGVALDLVLREGDARAAIVAEAVRRRADLVVVGTRGHAKLRRWLFGSVADHVVRAAPCDVLVVR